jgi:hypothetical protein
MKDLAKAARGALDDITSRGYHGGLKIGNREIIDLGLAVYGDGSRVSARSVQEKKLTNT